MDIYEVPGGYEDIRQEPFVGLWAGTLQARSVGRSLPLRWLARIPMNNRQILIFDDESQNIKHLQKLLLSLGWDVLTASNGREALETVQSSKPRVIVLDMVMPQIDWFQVASFLKRHPEYRPIPILAATSLSSRRDRERCFAAGCDDYLLNLLPQSNSISALTLSWQWPPQAFSGIDDPWPYHRNFGLPFRRNCLQGRIPMNWEAGDPLPQQGAIGRRLLSVLGRKYFQPYDLQFDV